MQKLSCNNPGLNGKKCGYTFFTGEKAVPCQACEEWARERRTVDVSRLNEGKEIPLQCSLYSPENGFCGKDAVYYIDLSKERRIFLCGGSCMERFPLTLDWGLV